MSIMIGVPIPIALKISAVPSGMGLGALLDLLVIMEIPILEKESTGKLSWVPLFPWIESVLK